MDKERIVQELTFKAVRSSGAGGQHVNKVASKVELTFDPATSASLTEDEKTRIYKKLENRLTKEGIMIMHCEDGRSQHKNKELVVKRFLAMLERALKVPKKRKKTKPSKAAVEKRLKAKRKSAQKKVSRRKPDTE
ncbi:MAG TPA: alternative ribosome rescue aminoacyl-tRNA hydrolase ArfB [Eudoraea sp.]|nr:alternative ribosome rescue aminoacyl-tRNA hydrolase ArfB [Eudoraea sp.]